MSKGSIIEAFKEVVIQIATPYSIGTGFYLPDVKIIVTNEHVVRDNKEVVVKGATIEKQKAVVKYLDAKYDLAFLEASVEMESPDSDFIELSHLNEGDIVIAIGHPFGFKYAATEGILSNLDHNQDGVRYIQHDAALNPGNSGGPLLNQEGKIIGINTFVVKDGNNIGFSLPAQYLKASIETYISKGRQESIRCNSCSNIIVEEEIQGSYCMFCGSRAQAISSIEPYEPLGVNKTIEEMLVKANIDIDLSRRGPNQWEIKRGSANINISYHTKSGLIIGDAFLCQLPNSDISEIYKYLLRENYNLEGLTLSVKKQDIILSLLIYDQYLNVESADKLFEKLYDAADYYDNILVEQFGAIWKADEY